MQNVENENLKEVWYFWQKTVKFTIISISIIYFVMIS